MTTEIEAITSGKDSSRFLGAIIAVTRPTNPSQPTPHEIVDGQQRLTTLYIFLLAAAQVAARQGKTEYARGLLSTNLIVDWAQDLTSNTKLQPSIGDRGQFRKIFDRVSNTGELSDWLPLKVRLPQPAGEESGQLLRQYNRIHKFLHKKVTDHGFAALESVVEAVRNSMTFVFILLKDPGSATTVFEGLNDPGVPISVGDLVKNEVFARVGYDEPTAQALHDNRWIPFRERFGDSFNDYFFPYGVVHKSNTNRTEMFGDLRVLWKELSAEDIIDELGSYADAFLAIHGVSNPREVYGPDVAACVQRLVDLHRPSSVYPFLLPLLKQLSDKQIGRKDVVGCVGVIEAFLVRRAVCGIEPTGLLGLFRTMWASTDGHPTADKVASTILKRLTVEWPTDQRFREAITTRPIFGSSIARYVVAEYDRSLGMDQPDDIDLSLEHVMPKSYCDAWSDVVGKSEHAKIANLWANLVPLSKAMNSEVDQSPYAVKRGTFASESMYTSARQLAETYDSWGPNEIQVRSQVLADWAVSRWPRISSA